MGLYRESESIGIEDRGAELVADIRLCTFSFVCRLLLFSPMIVVTNQWKPKGLGLAQGSGLYRWRPWSGWCTNAMDWSARLGRCVGICGEHRATVEVGLWFGAHDRLRVRWKGHGAEFGYPVAE